MFQTVVTCLLNTLWKAHSLSSLTPIVWCSTAGDCERLKDQLTPPHNELSKPHCLCKYRGIRDFWTTQNTFLVTWWELNFICSGMELVERWKCKGIRGLIDFRELFISGSYTVYSLGSFVCPRPSKCQATDVVRCVHAGEWNNPTPYPKGTSIFYNQELRNW